MRVPARHTCPALKYCPAIVDAVSGAHSGGLATTVFPDASAGPTFQVSSMSGAFQGETRAATPAGSKRTRFVTSGESIVWRFSFSAQSAKKLTLSAARGI